MTLLSLLLAAAPATAGDTGTDTAALRTSCAGDYARFCPGLDPRGREIVACFRRNVAAVSPGCLAAIAEYRARSSDTGTLRP